MKKQQTKQTKQQTTKNNKRDEIKSQLFVNSNNKVNEQNLQKTNVNEQNSHLNNVSEQNLQTTMKNEQNSSNSNKVEQKSTNNKSTTDEQNPIDIETVTNQIKAQELVNKNQQVPLFSTVTKGQNLMVQPIKENGKSYLKFKPPTAVLNDDVLLKDTINSNVQTTINKPTSVLVSGNPSYEVVTGKHLYDSPKGRIQISHQINEGIELETNIDVNYANEMEQATTLITQELTTALSSGGFLGDYSGMITAISTSVISITASIVSALYIENLVVRLLNISSVLANLTSIAHQIAIYLKKKNNMPFDTNAALAAATKAYHYVRDMVSEESTNSVPCSANWIKPAITVVITVILAGLTQVKDIGTQGVLKFMSFFRGLSPTVQTAQDATAWIMETVCGVDIYGYESIREDYKKFVLRTTELATIPAYKFVIDSNLNVELNAVIAKAIEYTTAKLPRDMSESLKTTNGILINCLSHLRDKAELVKSILATQDRQETIMFLMEGPGGHGKSRAGKYLAKEVAKILGYNENIYNLEKNGEYFNPYGGNDIAHIQEVFNCRVMEDTFLPMANTICSGDPCNLEGASLSAKTQPCRIKLIAGTTNNSNPDLHRRMHVNAAEAFWSRIVRVRIYDPLFEGRTGQSNAHRRPDFSHLKVQVCTKITTAPVEADWEECTFEAFQHTITRMVAKKEELFMRAARETFIGTGEQQFNMPVDEYNARLQFLDRLLLRLTPAPQQQAGKSFFVVRTQGPAGTFKTKLIDKMANDLAFITGFKIKGLNDDSLDFSIPPTEKAIYVLDDILVEKDYEEYLKWINKGDTKSIYLIGTNHSIRIEKKPWWDLRAFVPHYKLNADCSSGIVRRLGLDAPVVFNGEYLLNDAGSQTTIQTDSPGMYMINGKTRTARETVELVFSKYKSYCNNLIGITRINEHYIGTASFDIDISCPSITLLTEMLKSKHNTFKAWLHEFEGCTIKASHEIRTRLYDIRLSEGWNINHNITSENLIELMENMSARFRKIIPEANLRIKIGDKTTSLVENILYVGDGLGEFVESIEISETGIAYNDIDERYNVAWPDYVIWEQTKEMQGTAKHVPLSVLKAMFLLIQGTSLPILDMYRHQYQQTSTIRDKIASGTYDYIISHPITKIVFGLIAVCTAGAIITLIYKMFKHFLSSKEEYPVANTGDDSIGSPSRSKHLHREYKAALMSRNQTEVSRIQEQAKKEGCSESLNTFEHEWRSNSISSEYEHDMKELKNLILTAINEGDIPTMDYFWRTNKNLVMETLQAKPQMLPSNMLPCKASTLEAISNKIRNNYVLIKNNQGQNLALALGGRKFLTVSHTTPDIGYKSTIHYNLNGSDVSHEVECYAINRSRDIAFYECKAKIPEFRDLTNMITTEEHLSELQSGTIVKRNGSHHTAPLEYYPKMAVRLTDRTDPLKLWDCDEKIICSSTLGLQLPAVVSLGDCGTVIMGLRNNEWSIIGIHIGIQVGHLYFASITRKDLDFFESKPNTTSDDLRTLVNPIDGQDYVIDDFMLSLLRKPFKFSKYEHTPNMKVLGYNQAMKLYSKPENRAVFYPAKSNLATSYLPSATDLKFVEDTSELAKDYFGNADPLWTQCVNYTMLHPNARKWNTDIFEHTQQLMTQKMAEDFGKPRRFTLYEVINGRNECKQLPWTTSAGSKLKLKYNIQTKRPFANPSVLFEEYQQGMFKINTNTEAGAGLLEDYQLKKDAIMRSLPFAIIVRDNAKVELIPAEQAKKGKVRLFSELELADNMVLKSFFGYIQEIGQARHHKNDWQIGYNPYVDPVAIMKEMNDKPGDVISSDCKRLDKTILPEMIRAFVRSTQTELTPTQCKALEDSLIYTIHNINGNIFFLDRGNESGSYITTMLNCYVLDFADVYAICAEFQKDHNRLPSLYEVRSLHAKKILGDDKLAKYHPYLKMDFEKIQYYCSLFNIFVTPPKTDEPYSFCSRDFIKDKQPFVYLPRLKKESIVARLFYFENYSRETVLQNCSGALSEAAFWDAGFFKEVEELVRMRLEAVGSSKALEYYPQEAFLKFYRLFVLGENNSPLLQAEASPNGTKNNCNKLKFIKQYPNFKMSLTYLNEYAQRKGLTITTTFSSTGDPHTPEWTAVLNLKSSDSTFNQTTEGEATSKGSAKTIAADKMMEYIKKHDYAIAVIELETGNHYYLLESTTAKVLGDIKRMGLVPEGIELVVHTPEQKAAFESNACLKNSHSVRMVNFGSTSEDATKQSDRPIEPASMNQAAQAMSTAAAVDLGNPQPTQVIPAITHESSPTNAAIELAPRQTLNTQGAPNMAGVGAVTFDLKQLIYSQFLDSDLELTIPSDAPAGTIVGVFPYGPEETYVNQRIKDYGKLHTRYTGAIEYRFTVIGNPLYSGSVMVAWLPEVPTESIVPISTLHQYAYHAEATTLPWNKIHVLHDARKTDFYREMGEAGPKRPCLVMALFMSIQNPLKEDAIVRVRIATKLQGAGGPNPFIFFNPATKPATILSAPKLNQVNIRPFASVFPSTRNQRIFMASDGNRYSNNTRRLDGIFYPPFNTINLSGNFCAWNDTPIPGTIDVARTYVNATAGFEGKRDDFKLLWKGLAELLDVDKLNAETRYFMGTAIVSNMPQDKLGKYTTKFPISQFYNEFSGNTTRLSQTEFDTIGRISSWLDGAPKQNVISIVEQSVLTTIRLEETAGWYRRYGHAKTFKVVTTDGTFSVVLMYMARFTGTNVLNSALTTLRIPTRDEIDNAILPNIPMTLIDTGVATPGTTPFLPGSYRAFRMTEMVPTSITYSVFNFRQPTLTDNSEVLRYFQGFNVSGTQCVQFQLLNNTSQRVFATIRYQESMFMINSYSTGDFYKTVPWTPEQISIINEVIIEKTQEFPYTDMSDWLVRDSTTYLSDLKAVNTDLPSATQLVFRQAVEEQGTPQAQLLAMLGGGAMSGVGQALGKWQEQNFQKDMQGNMFDHNLTMQNNMFGQQDKMQGGQFDQQTLMQKNMFDFNTLMQGNEFQFSKDMFNMQSDQNVRMENLRTQNDMSRRGISTQNSSMLGGGSVALSNPSSYGGESSA